MASTPPISLSPVSRSKETLIGMTIALEQRFGITPRNDLGTTLNTKFGVFQNRAPLNRLLTRYFCWGVGGKLNEANNLSSAQPISGTNMAPYAIRPFRAVPYAQDLSDTERAKYAMRRKVNIGGTDYCLYYLKLIEFTQDQVQYIRTDPNTGIVTNYELNGSNLSPTPPVAGDNGVITDVSDAVSAIVPGTLTITGQEAFESAAVVDGGDMRYAAPSELGFVSASTELVQATSFGGQTFSYSEAILAQMVDHYTWAGSQLGSTEDFYQKSFQFSLRNMIDA